MSERMREYVRTDVVGHRLRAASRAVRKRKERTSNWKASCMHIGRIQYGLSSGSTNASLCERPRSAFKAEDLAHCPLPPSVPPSLIKAAGGKGPSETKPGAKPPTEICTNRGASTSMSVACLEEEAKQAHAAIGSPVRPSHTSARQMGRSLGTVAICVLAFGGGRTTYGQHTTIPGTGNLWLAGMPSGTIADGGDVVPTNSPVVINFGAADHGAYIEFANASGLVRHGDTPEYPPEGATSGIFCKRIGAEHGKSDLCAPICAIIGVFLDDAMPTTPVPPRLEFNTVASRNFATLSPSLKQPFFIGNGQTDAGQTQRFMVPVGATRLFLSVMDSYEWNNNSGQFVISVAAHVLDVSRIDPVRHGSSGIGVVTVRGSSFQQGATARLVKNDSPDVILTAVQTTFVGSSELRASFNFAGSQLGVYDVAVTNPGGESRTLPQAFEIVDGGVALLRAALETPRFVRPGRDYTLWLNYSNDGGGDMPAPLFIVSSPENPLMRLSDKAPYAPGPVQVLGVNPDSPAGTLYAGSSGRIPIYFRAANLGGHQWCHFNLDQMVADDTQVNWAEIEPQVHPADIDTDAWAVIWSGVTTQMGSTWADYLAALSADANYLQQYGGQGGQVYDVRRLLSLEIAKAAGTISPRRVLAAAVDGYSPARVLPLVFVRTAYSSIDQRFRLGPLGRGWSHNFEYSLIRDDANHVRVRGPGGAVRSFVNYAGAWQAQPGDFGVLTEQAGVQYVLCEKDGLLWRFDPTGLLSYVEEQNGNRITLTYTGGLLTGIAHSNGQSFALSYDGSSRIATLTDHAGQVIQYAYNGEYLASVTLPGDRTTSYVNNPAGGPAAHALTAIGYPDGTHRYYGYDAQGWLAGQWRDGDSEHLSFAYEAGGTVRITDAANAVSTLRLGSYAEPLEAEDALAHVVQLRYDDAFNIPQLVGPDGGTWHATYDARGNPSSLHDAANQSITLGSTTDFSRLDWLKDQRNNLTDFQTDGDGNLTRITYPNSKYEQFTYDAAGNVTAVRNRRGQTVTYTYNALGRVTQKAYPGGWTIDYTYDGRGNLLTAADSVSGTISMQYDARDFLTRIEYPGGYWFTFAYNDAGRRTQRTSHDGDVLNYQYDAAGRLARLKDGSNAVIVQYTYDDTGRLVREDKGNGTYTTYDYDLVGRVEHVVNYAPDDTEQSRFDYTYDENGNPLTMTTGGNTTTYAYDAIGQLTGVSGPTFTATYEYDPAGNRTSVTENGVQSSYSTNNMNQYMQVGSATYVYDDDGNLVSKTDATGTTTYEYDIENRLTRVVTPTDGTWEYGCDAFGNRVTVTHNGATTRYVRDPAGLVDVAAEYDGSGVLNARYTHGLGLVSRADAGGAAYYAYDAIGHTRQLTDATGAVANTYDYAPFGAPLAVSETIPNPFRFVGRYGVAEEGNGLTFMRARYYALAFGRFVSADPYRYATHEANAYTYGGNRPLSTVDPSGLSDDPFYNLDLGQGAIDLGVMLGDGRAYNYWYWRYTKGIPPVIHNRMIHSWSKVTGVVDVAGKALNGIGVIVAWQQYFNTASAYVNGRASALDLYHDWGVAGWALLFGWGNAGIIGTLVDEASQAWADYLYPTAESITSGSSETITAWDPNEKHGPQGWAAIGSPPLDGQPMAYSVFFENQASASAAAQEVIITDYLDPDLDWTTFELGEIAFGSYTVADLGGRSAGSVRVPLEDSTLVVDIAASIDPYSGRALWTLCTIDPQTGALPEDPLAGFLPPNDETHRGEGHVTFTVLPRADLAPNAQLVNSASIVFDTNPAISTNAVTLTVRVLGDLNCDGVLDGRDIQPFVLALMDPVAYAAAYPNCEASLADMDRSGTTDVADIGALVLALLGPWNGIPGDVGGDGSVGPEDIGEFVGVLLGTDTNPYHVAAADLDNSGAADGLDIQPFVNALLGG